MGLICVCPTPQGKTQSKNKTANDLGQSQVGRRRIAHIVVPFCPSILTANLLG
jgi:hypothetical protein